MMMIKDVSSTRTGTVCWLETQPSSCSQSHLPGVLFQEFNKLDRPVVSTGDMDAETRTAVGQEKEVGSRMRTHTHRDPRLVYFPGSQRRK